MMASAAERQAQGFDSFPPLWSSPWLADRAVYQLKAIALTRNSGEGDIGIRTLFQYLGVRTEESHF